MGVGSAYPGNEEVFLPPFVVWMEGCFLQLGDLALLTLRFRKIVIRFYTSKKPYLTLLKRGVRRAKPQS